LLSERRKHLDLSERRKHLDVVQNGERITVLKEVQIFLLDDFQRILAD
jgi:hypothetical protein